MCMYLFTTVLRVSNSWADRIFAMVNSKWRPLAYYASDRKCTVSSQLPKVSRITTGSIPTLHSFKRRNTRNYGQCHPSNKNIQRYVSVKSPFKSCAISNIETLRILEDYVTTTIFTLILLDGTKFSKPIEEMSKEELNVFFTSFCTSARKMAQFQFTKAQWNASDSRHWSFPSPAASQQTVLRYLWPRFYWGK